MYIKGELLIHRWKFKFTQPTVAHDPRIRVWLFTPSYIRGKSREKNHSLLAGQEPCEKRRSAGRSRRGRRTLRGVTWEPAAHSRLEHCFSDMLLNQSQGEMRIRRILGDRGRTDSGQPTAL